MSKDKIASPVLITGAGGFIGSHLTEMCVERGLRVRAFVHYNSGGEWGWLDHSPVKKDIEVIMGDVRDYDAVSQAVKGCQSIFHLAALIGIPYSYVSPLAYLRTNVEGTYNVLESARRLGVGNVVVTSTSEAYGSAQRVPIDESHPISAQSPYAASKVGADSLALSYHRSFDLPVKIARPFNTFGPRQSARAIIPTIITQIVSGRKQLCLGNLEPTRDLNYVTDTASGILAIAEEKALIGQATNIGSGKEISIKLLVERIASLLGASIEVTVDPQRLRPEASEVDRLCADASKLHSATGWTPKVDLADGLAKTIEWFQENQAHYKPQTYGY